MEVARKEKEMKVEKVFGTVTDGTGWERTVLKTDGTYTPYVIVTGYNGKDGWASAYAYLETKQDLATVILQFIADGGEFKGELVF